MIIFVLLILILIIYVNIDANNVSKHNNFYYGSPFYIREGMETLRPQTTYIDGACYPYSKVIHFPTGGAQSRLIFNYWSNKVLSEEIRKTHEEWMQQRTHPKPHDRCIH